MDISSCLILFFLTFLEHVNGSNFFLYHKQKANWFEADTRCFHIDKNFARVASESDQFTIQSLTPHAQGFFWIGLKGNATQGKFVWTDSSEVDYVNWAEGFPGKTDGLDCVRMRHFDFKWETFNCSTELHYLCQDKYQRKPYVVTADIKAKGLALGFGFGGGLIFMMCLIMQLSCCRVRMQRKIESLTFDERVHHRENKTRERDHMQVEVKHQNYVFPQI